MLQCRIAERAFHHRLAVVEFPLNRHRAHVVAQRGHELALALADFAEREQHEDADAGHAMEGVRHGGPGVAAGGGEDRELLAALLQKASQQSRHQLRGKILERRRRSLIQAHDMHPVIDFFQRHGKVVGLATHRRQRVGGNDAVRVFHQHAERDFVIRLLSKGGDFLQRELGKCFRQIKSAVRRLALKQGLAQVDRGRLAVGASKKQTHAQARPSHRFNLALIRPSCVASSAPNLRMNFGGGSGKVA